MDVRLNIQRGIRGIQRPLTPMWLDVGSVGATSSWAGSYHVLAMGRHYDDYVVTSRTIGLPVIAGFPLAHPYERLAGKIRAAGVTGNIGEAIAAIFARRYLGAQIGDIAHVRPCRPFRRRKAPDYLMRLGPLMPAALGPIIPTGASFTWPNWWPVESKARSTEAGSKAARGDALRQLLAYWSVLALSQPEVVGFGVIVALTYQPPREVRVNVILPRDRTRLTRALQQNGEDTSDVELRTCLYDC